MIQRSEVWWERSWNECFIMQRARNARGEGWAERKFPSFLAHLRKMRCRSSCLQEVTTTIFSSPALPSHCCEHRRAAHYSWHRSRLLRFLFVTMSLSTRMSSGVTINMDLWSVVVICSDFADRTVGRIHCRSDSRWRRSTLSRCSCK